MTELLVAERVWARATTHNLGRRLGRGRIIADQATTAHLQLSYV